MSELRINLDGSTVEEQQAFWAQARTLAAASPRPAVSTVTNVELVAVGSWDACTPSGGKFVVSSDDLRQAIAAIEAGDARPPVVKLGHDSPLNDGQPAFGKVQNLRLSDDGMTLIGDLAGVPTWLADILASAYPKRSIEGYQDYTSDTGRSYGLLLTAVALLGEAYPAVETLDDIKAAWQTDAPPLVTAGVTTVAASMTMGDGAMPTTTSDPVPVSARATDDQIWTAFYQAMPWSYWVRELYVDPMEIIATDDDTGHTMRVPYSVDADGNVTFGDPVRVAVEYRDVTTTASAGRRLHVGAGSKTFATADEYRKVAATSPDGGADEEGVHDMTVDPKLLRSHLGLAEDAGDEEVQAALEAAADSAAQQATAEVDEPETAVEEAAEELPVAAGAAPADGTTLVVSREVWEQQTAFVAAAMHREEQDALDQAVRQKRITAGERGTIAKRFSNAELRASTLELLTGDDAAVKAGRALAPGTTGAVNYQGHAGDGPAESDTPSPERVAAKASMLLGRNINGGR